jgi:hypothetical protein
LRGEEEEEGGGGKGERERGEEREMTERRGRRNKLDYLSHARAEARVGRYHPLDELDETWAEFACVVKCAVSTHDVEH